jgi:hypothetical protein
VVRSLGLGVLISGQPHTRLHVLISLLAAVCTYIKYLATKDSMQIAPPGSGVSHRFNKVTLAFGLASCVGLDIVANFQESNVIVVHMLGAFLCFAAGTIYFILQASQFVNLKHYL